MFNSAKSEKGVILPLLGILILLAGIVAGYFLLKNPQVFKSRADNPAIVAKDRSGNPLEVVNNVAKTTDTKIKLELTSPLGPAGIINSPSPVPSLTPAPVSTPMPVSKPQPPVNSGQQESNEGSSDSF